MHLLWHKICNLKRHKMALQNLRTSMDEMETKKNEWKVTMHWIIGSIAGSISLVLLNGLLKKLSYSQVINSIPITILSLLSTYCFWFAWQNSDGFLRVWFIQSAMVSIGAFVVNFFILQEKIGFTHVIAIALITCGAYLLHGGK